MSAPLLKRVGSTAPACLEDFLLIMAKNIEASLIQGGAEPGKDYSIRDLYSWAMPFAIESFKNGTLTFASEDF